MRVRLFIFILFTPLLLLSNEHIDSLIKKLNIVQDQKRLLILNELSSCCLDSSVILAIDFGISALELAIKLNNENEKAIALKNIAFAYYYQSDYAKAMEYAQKTFEIYIKLIDKKGAAKILNFMGVVHKNMENYNTSLEFTKKAHDLYVEINDKDGIASTLNNIGIAYKALGKKERAILYYQQSLKIKEELGDDKGIANTLNNLGLIYAEIGDLTIAYEFYSKSLYLRKKIRDDYGIASSYANIGNYYILTKNYSKATLYLDSAMRIAKRDSFLDILQRVYYSLYEANLAQQDYKKALEYYKYSYIIQDSISDNWTKSRIDELKVKYEAESKEKENEILRQKSRINDLEIIRQRNIQNTLIWALILIVIYILVLILYFRYRIKQKANVRLKQLNEVLERIVAERTQDIQNEIDVRVKTEKALRKSEEEFRSLFEESPDAIFVEDEHGIILDINPAACKLHKMSREQLLGIHVSELVPDELKETTRENYNKWFTGELSYIESESIRSDGKTISVEIRCSKIEYKGKKALLLHVRDITARTQMEQQLRGSEAKYRSIFSQANDAIFLMDRIIFIDCNNKTLEMFDCEKKDVIGNPPTVFSPIFQPDGISSMEKMQHYIAEVLKGKPQRFYWKHIRKNGSEFDAEVSLNIFESERQKLIQAIVRDITEQKQTEEALIKAKKEAEETTRLKSLFLANVSHEIRTPMYGIVGMTDLMMKTPLTNEQSDYLASINVSASSLLTIVNDILDLSKIEAGQLELEQINFDLRTVISEIVTVMNYKAKKKGISLITNISGEIPAILQGDPLRLKQVITNLSDNAIKFTDKGNVKIIVELREQFEEHNKLKLKFSIIDSGIGISLQEQGKLFKSFSQTDASTTRKFGGTGLGLAISKNLVELMGGDIGVFSEIEKGSTFWFTCIFELGKDFPKEKTSAEITVETKTKKLLSILVAEDNLINQKVISASLKQLGHEVTIADNGIETIELFKSRQFDLILMDVQMPDMDGIEATKRIRIIEKEQHKNQITIIALTANAMKEDKEKCLEAGMNYYLSKPFKNSDLIDLLNN